MSRKHIDFEITRYCSHNPITPGEVAAITYLINKYKLCKKLSNYGNKVEFDDYHYYITSKFSLKPNKEII